MAIVKLFIYDWPGYMTYSAVGLDSEDGRAYDLLYVPTYGNYGTRLEQQVPITYDEVRKKARIAHDTALAEHAAFIVDSADYDSLDETTWRQFVQDPPRRVINQSAR